MKKTVLAIFTVFLCIMLCGCSVIWPAKYALEEDLENFENNLKSSVDGNTDVLTKAVAENFSFDVGKQTENEETGAVTVKVEITTVDVEDLEKRAEAKCGNNQEKMNAWIEDAVKKGDYKLVTNEADVPMVKDTDGKWQIDIGGDIFDFTNAFTGGLGNSIFSKEATVK